MGFFSRLFKSPDQLRATAVYFTKEPDYEDVALVGESSYRDNLLAITGREDREQVRFDAVAALVPEPAKPAIHVQIDGLKVGFFDDRDCRDYLEPVSDAFDRSRPIACDAWIASPEGGKMLGVILFLPSPAQLREELEDEWRLG